MIPLSVAIGAGQREDGATVKVLVLTAHLGGGATFRLEAPLPDALARDLGGILLAPSVHLPGPGEVA